MHLGRFLHLSQNVVRVTLTQSTATLKFAFRSNKVHFLLMAVFTLQTNYTSRRTKPAEFNCVN